MYILHLSYVILLGYIKKLFKTEENDLLIHLSYIYILGYSLFA